MSSASKCPLYGPDIIFQPSVIIPTQIVFPLGAASIVSEYIPEYHIDKSRFTLCTLINSYSVEVYDVRGVNITGQDFVSVTLSGT
jgi:hypothetical protein